ncbi:MAG: Sec-independent protein translocase protein TatB [Acetobacteraceae bacterium]|nr:Sec-independent protein translocase protein TatB [Acetobacteraceae bacterium]
MFDLGWSEIAVIVVVAVVVIGPKDLPAAVRGVAQQIARLRRWAAEARGTLDEVVREAKLDEVRNQINEIRNFDLRGEMERAVDPTGDLRKTFEDDPLRDIATPAWTPPPPPKTAADIPDAPAFVPPQTLAPPPPVAPPPPPPPVPSFLPPSTPAPPGLAGAPPPAAAPEPAPPAQTRT